MQFRNLHGHDIYKYTNDRTTLIHLPTLILISVAEGLFTGGMSFLSANQQNESTEGSTKNNMSEEV